jgi:2-oxoglutarate dehydrogenase E2 component (dihydrolipoamide succinyltransferase)
VPPVDPPAVPSAGDGASAPLPDPVALVEPGWLVASAGAASGIPPGVAAASVAARAPVAAPAPVVAPASVSAAESAAVAGLSAGSVASVESIPPGAGASG